MDGLGSSPGQDHGMPDPLVLGRSVVVGPGASPPEQWASCERIRVTSVDRATADELSVAWRARRSVVVELTPGLGLDDPLAPPDEVVMDRQPWQWPVDLDLVGERLHHALWSNTVDARGGAAHVRWHWGDMARRLGAAGADSADVVLPDGTPAICDGGPLDASLPGRMATAVVHRISLEHDSLQPLGPNDGSGLALAPDQLDAVTEPGGPARIIAPAGSGKTRVLTERARLLLRGWGLPPGAAAMVGYNVRAADEIRARLADVSGARVRTFNSLGLRLCGNRSTIEEMEVRRILGDLVTFPRRAESDPAAPWIEALSRLRLGLASPDTVEEELPDVSDLERVARRYRALLSERNVVDYDEQITGAIERLLADPAFRRRSQRFARVLLVDEFQDLTPAHLLLIRLLSGPAGAVYGVGDDDQTIYGYAGATPRWLVDFESWFPGAALHSLEVNYRCPAPVVTAASNLLTHNALRVKKVIRAAPVEGDGDGEGEGDGDAPDFTQALTILAPGAGPARRSGQRVQALLEAGATPGDVAVLARVNASLAPVQVMLRHAAIAVNGPIDGRFLNRGGVRAALAWLAVATAPSSALPAAMLREAARHPKRGMSASLVDLVSSQHSEESMLSLSRWLEGKDNTREADKVSAMTDDIALVRAAAAKPGATTADVLATVRLRVGQGGLAASATALDRWSHGAIASHGDDLDALVELAELEPDPVHFGAWLSAQLAVPADRTGVTLASIHAVKGREWPHVVIHHATDGLLPHRLAEDIEEERRVFHVALTRGRSTVSIAPGAVPSPFLVELDAPGQPSAAPPRRVREPESAPSPAPAKGAEPVAVEIGLSFTHGGHDYEVIEILDSGVRSRVTEATATTTNAFGTTVRYHGQPAMLAHPRVEAAWEALREWRAKQAKTLGKPAYVVFDDKTLRLVAALLPTSEAGLLAVSGIGPVKLEAYGDDLIAIAESLRAG